MNGKEEGCTVKWGCTRKFFLVAMEKFDTHGGMFCAAPVNKKYEKCSVSMSDLSVASGIIKNWPNIYIFFVEFIYLSQFGYVTIEKSTWQQYRSSAQSDGANLFYCCRSLGMRGCITLVYLADTGETKAVIQTPSWLSD